MSANGKSRPLLESENKTDARRKSFGETARKLGVSYNTYKKYAKLYGIMERCKCTDASGLPKVHNPYRGKYPLEEILMGMHPIFSITTTKKLIASKIKIEECEVCVIPRNELQMEKYHLCLHLKMVIEQIM